MKESPIAQWVRQAMAKSGLSQRKLSGEIQEKLRRHSDDKSIINKVLVGDPPRELSADEMLAIEEITKLPIPSVYAPTMVPLLDYVTAGTLSEPRSQIPVENVPLLAFADLGRGDFFALKVEGTSMDRVSPEGSIVVVNRADKQPVNGGYYVFRTKMDGTTYKRWRGGDPPYLAPYSWDASHGPIFVKKLKDLQIIGRVRRTLLDL